MSRVGARLCVRGWASRGGGIAPVLSDVTGDPSFKNFFDLLTLPSRSAAWAARQTLMQQPVSRDVLFAGGKSVSGKTVSELLTALVVQGQVEQAHATLCELLARDDARLELVHFNTVLAGLARTGQCETFERLWTQLRERGLGPGDVFTFSSAAKCYMEGGQVEKALAVVQRAKEAKVAPSEVLYGALLTGFAQRNDLKGAEAVWDFLRTTRGAPKIDTVLYTAMIHACGKAGQAERALALLEEMQSEGLVPTEVTYNAALYATARRRDKWQEGKMLFQAMLRAGMEPTEYTMNTLLLCASRAGDVASCRRIVRDMVEVYKMPVSQLTLNTQLHGLARALKVCESSERTALVKESEELYGQIVERFGADDNSRLARLHVYTSGHMLDRAVAVFAEQTVPRSMEAHTIMLKMWSEVGRPKELEAAWKCCKQEIERPDSFAYRWAIEGFARGYWINTAVDTLRDMVVNAKLLPRRRHISLLVQRCSQEDLRGHRLEVNSLIRQAEAEERKSLVSSRNQAALMMQKLRGDGVRPFLLPFPVEHAKLQKN